MMDPDDSTERYQGVVQWHGESIAESVEAYFKQSEQLKTRIILAVNDERAAGILLQVMPESKKAEATDKDAAWDHVLMLTNTLQPAELLQHANTKLLELLYAEDNVRVFDEEPVTFKCTCSSERGENAILLLGKDIAEDELYDKQVIVVKCEFCGCEFTFDKQQVELIFNKYPPTSSTHH